MTNDAVTSTRTKPRPGMLVRAASQAIGAATAAESRPTQVATTRLILSGARNVSSVTSRSRFASVGAPLASVRA